jgi:hypothetical protein
MFRIDAPGISTMASRATHGASFHQQSALALFLKNEMEPVPCKRVGAKQGDFMSEAAIVANAFGADAIRRDGHEAWLGAA